ncbi:16S rRNA (cytidine(1402)-2'-O)-methyltransferase [Candidatus Nitrosacidococcus sp. I8]|uniref:16S rRNA (cytidine(1402)-2'-O)-methyltransferase n=1 Tax=Candidatus Nitrosacidococcus sp. I8 TaxID=2942908 RepID=UPI0022262D49|nr:16S rRNA (cytidine(1402)-2'-O)-methyltransferase [Candidatus Nitrosacidococcus sp. I8]CAH9019333.1 Ribosomal RNA small subunit methyltransferase I [Candidatus Nitrosacidococcus sp. I8]
MVIANKIGTLYIVATPIGNLKDFSFRAQETLQKVKLIAAEDTRHSATLLKHFNITTPIVSLHEYNELERSKVLIAHCQNGDSIALISDAGTPLISDPGYRLVQQARLTGILITPIPGPCALIAALSVAGLPSDRFVFEGFLSAKPSVRYTRLNQLAKETRTLIFYEAPHRLLDTLEAMVKVLGSKRKVALAKELTKLYETVWEGSLNLLLTQLKDDSILSRGEFVVLVHGAEEDQEDMETKALNVLIPLLKVLPLKQAVVTGSEITGIKKNYLYQLALKLNNG